MPAHEQAGCLLHTVPRRSALSAARIAPQNAIARTYPGPQTGLRVLENAIGRGEIESITAALTFVVVRDFTALSRELGAQGIIPLLNERFDALAQAVEPVGGEILKFIARFRLGEPWPCRAWLRPLLAALCRGCSGRRS